MRTLLLVRHAKSSWAEPGLGDFDRPLNDRGKRDAPEMARRIRKKNISVDLLVSSPAKRASKTARLFAEELSINPDQIKYVPELYLAGTAEFIRAIKFIDDSYNTIAIFSHNPGITEFANSLTSVRVDEMPTCAVYALTGDSNSWKTFMEGNKQFLFFDYPKSI